MKLKFLTNCKDDFEAQMVEGLLKSAGIPVERRHRGAGHAHIIYGGVGLDVDLLVPESRHQEAMKLLETYQQEEEDELS